LKRNKNINKLIVEGAKTLQLQNKKMADEIIQLKSEVKKLKVIVREFKKGK
jgi:hypothetical protein